MTERRTPEISSRKTPRQARSTDLVAAILEAALQVLASDGARRFTTTRVAERAGVSVGSIYQYFPNKAAILFRLQTDEWRETTALMSGILADARRAPLARWRALVIAFVRSECDEVAIRTALADAAPLYRDAPEADAARAEGRRAVSAFMAQALPDVPAARRTLAGEMLVATLGAVGKQISERARTRADIESRANALADMLCAYLGALGATDGPRSAVSRRIHGPGA